MRKWILSTALACTLARHALTNSSESSWPLTLGAAAVRRSGVVLMGSLREPPARPAARLGFFLLTGSVPRR